MLWQVTLSRPIDVFDLFFHGVPAVLLAVRLLAWRKVPLLEENRADYSS